MIKTSLHNKPELVGGFNVRDQSAFREIYKCTHLAVYRIAIRFVSDQVAAEDIMAETFIRLWTSTSIFEHPAKLEAFLFETARNQALNYLRSKKRYDARIVAFGADQEQSEEMAFNEQVVVNVYELLFQQIRLLPPKMSDVILLQLNGLSNTEIAHRLGIAEKSVRNLKSEAVKMLRHTLPKKEFFIFLLMLWDK